MLAGLDRRQATSQPPHFVGPLPDGHLRSVLTNDPATGLFAGSAATSPVKHSACPGFSPRRPHSAENSPDRWFPKLYEPKVTETNDPTRYARAGSRRAQPPRVPPREPKIAQHLRCQAMFTRPSGYVLNDLSVHKALATGQDTVDQT